MKTTILDATADFCLFQDPASKSEAPARLESDVDSARTASSCCSTDISSDSFTTASRDSHRDRNLHSGPWPNYYYSQSLRPVLGAVRSSPLPPFALAMSRRNQPSVPETPNIIPPSPTLTGRDAKDYAPPTTRSAARRSNRTSPAHDLDDLDEVPELRRARTRSRSPIDSNKLTRMTPSTSKAEATTTAAKVDSTPASNGLAATPPTNGHLAPPQTLGWSWRDISRSPSPLGLIPIHRHWRTFVHKHEVPRKALHVSIGFFVVWLYTTGTDVKSVPPYLMTALVPIASADLLRHRFASFNRFYVRVLGALMRESEFAGYNGTIFYLLGAWTVLYFFPKDVGVMSVLLLSWCDTAASTFGRLWGRYTPRLRRGKSLAGSMAAFVVGIATSVFFYGWLVPTIGPMPGDEDFMFKGTLSLPESVTSAVGISRAAATVTGTVALSVMSLWSGFVASASEVVDIFGWDDNLTIPVLSGVGMWGFLKLFA